MFSVTHHLQAPGNGTHLVGRDAELRLLREVVAADRPSLLAAAVHGEGGIGKSALLHAVLRECRVPVLAAAADPWTQRTRYGVLLEALADHPSPVEPSGVRGAPLGERLVRTVVELCAQRPLVLAIDDLHWADAETLVLLQRLTTLLHDVPLTLLFTTLPHRHGRELGRLLDELARRGRLTELTLGPLDEDAVAAIALPAVGPHPEADVMRALTTAGGNPLYVQQVLTSATVRSLSRGEDPEGVGEPPPLRVAGLHELTSDARHVLVVAALLGQHFTVRDLSVATRRSVGDLLPVVREALDAGLLGERDDARLGFRHEVVRQSLYDELPGALRQELHRELARALQDADAGPGVVGPQLTRAALTRDEVGWVASVAADAATEVPAVAVELWRRVGTLVPPDDPRRHEALCGEAAALYAVGRLSEAESVARTATAELLAPPLAGSAYLTLVSAALARGDHRGAQRFAAAGCTAPLLFPHQRAEHRALAALAALLGGDASGAHRLAAQAEAESRRTGSARATLRTVAVQGWQAHAQGRLEMAATLLAQATVLARGERSAATVDVLVPPARAAVLADLDRFEDALEALDESAETVAAHGSLVARRAWTRARVNLALDRGDLVTAAPLLAETLHDEEVGRPSRRLQLARRTVVALHLKGPQAAGRWLATVGEAPAGPPGLPGSAWPDRAEALVLVAQEDREAALEVLWRGWRQCLVTGWSPDRLLLGTELAALAAEVGERAMAEAAVAGLDELAERAPAAPTPRAAALAARAFAARDDDLLLAAVLAWSRSSRELQAAWVVEAVAGHLSEERQQDADELLQWAAAAYGRLGARADALRMRAVLRGRGLRVSGRDAPRPSNGWDALTPTERIVAGHVEQGRTNAEIADRLVLSRRTVESHVSRILAKLELRSRRDLIIAAAQDGRIAEQAGSTPP